MSSQNLPRLIVLNGASSAGKSLTAQALLQLTEHAYIVTGLDDILERVQPFGSEEHKGGFAPLIRPFRILLFQLTNGRLKLFLRLHREVVTHVQSGKKVIVDTSLMDRQALLDAAACFAPLGGFFIGMKPPLVISEQWELQRMDRTEGQARKHYALIHAYNTYDLVIDPSTMTPQQCAEAILEYTTRSQPHAFVQLLQQKQ